MYRFRSSKKHYHVNISYNIEALAEKPKKQQLPLISRDGHMCIGNLITLLFLSMKTSSIRMHTKRKKKLMNTQASKVTNGWPCENRWMDSHVLGLSNPKMYQQFSTL